MVAEMNMDTESWFNRLEVMLLSSLHSVVNKLCVSGIHSVTECISAPNKVFTMHRGSSRMVRHWYSDDRETSYKLAA
jgi:hypothetical protein